MALKNTWDLTGQNNMELVGRPEVHETAPLQEATGTHQGYMETVRLFNHAIVCYISTFGRTPLKYMDIL